MFVAYMWLVFCVKSATKSSFTIRDCFKWPPCFCFILVRLVTSVHMIQMNGTHIQTIPIQQIAIRDTLPSCTDVFLFLKAEVPFLYITVVSIRRLTPSSKVKPDKICVTILHVQIQVCMQHRCFLFDFRCFRFWRTNFSCFNCCFWFNGSLYDSCLWLLCCNCWHSSIWHHIRV